MLKGKIVLIADDEPDLREILREEFKSVGSEVFEAENGKVAFELFKKSKIDIVVSDIRMPGGDGIELLKNIRSFENSAKVFLITGFADVNADEAKKLGALALFNKPFDFPVIVSKVESFLTE